MVLGQYWLSSHPSSESAHSQLSPREMSRIGTALSERQTHHFVYQPEILHLPPVGRTTATAGRLPRAQEYPPAAKASDPMLTFPRNPAELKRFLPPE